MAGSPQGGSPSNWQALQKAGVQKYRLQINWNNVAEVGPWNQAATWENTYDRDFIQAAANNIAILPYLYGREGKSSEYYLKGGDHYSEWLSFVEYVVRRYGQNGTFWNAHPELPQLPVTAWEVWNEPDLPNNCPSHSCNGTTYGEFLVGTAAAIRNAQLSKGYSTTVLFGGLYMEMWNFHFETFLKNAAKVSGIKTAYDGLSIHPYAIGRAVGEERGENLGIEPERSWVDKVGAFPSSISYAYNAQANTLGAHPLWVTEVGWPIDEGVDTSNNANVQTVDEGEQAGLVTETYSWAKSNYSSYNLKYLAWYDYNDVDEPAWAYHTGLRDVNDDYRQGWYSYEGQTGAAAWPPSFRYMLGTSTGTGNFNWNYTNLTNFFQPMRMAVGDISGDGRADIVSQEKEASAGKYVYVRGISNGSGEFGWSGTNLTGMSEALKMDVGDVTGDKKADIVAVENEGSGKFRYMLGTSTGTGNFNWNFTNLKGFNRPVAMSLGDITGDGKADIVAVEKEAVKGTTYTYVRGISNGAGGFQWEGTGLKGMNYPFKMALGDINGDGRADIVAVEKNPSNPGLYSYARGISLGNGSFEWKGVPGMSAMHQPVKLALGDLNGDSKADIVAVERNESDGLYDYVRGISNGSGEFAWAGSNLVKMGHSQRMDLGDVNGDGKADIVSVEH